MQLLYEGKGEGMGLTLQRGGLDGLAHGMVEDRDSSEPGARRPYTKGYNLVLR